MEHKILKNSERHQSAESRHHQGSQNFVNQFRHVDKSLLSARNRVQMLRNQLDQEKKKIQKNNQLTRQVLQKKSDINIINSLKKRDTSGEDRRISELKKRNYSMRLQQQKSIDDIRKAVYLVKLDDAREVKNVSQRLKRKLRNQEQEAAFQKARMKEKKKIESQKAKERYMNYWRQKIQDVYIKNNQFKQQLGQVKEQKTNQLKQLEEQEIKLLMEMDKYHTKQIEAKKQYVAALSLSAKDVAEAMGQSNSNTSNEQTMERSRSLNDMPGTALSRNKRYNLDGSSRISQQKLPNFSPKIKIPSANVDQNKLKIILKQLKKMDRKKKQHQHPIKQQQYDDNFQADQQ